MIGGSPSAQSPRPITLDEADAIIRAATVEVSVAPVSTVPTVSVRVIAFNQVRFIAQALDGALMQVTSFPFEIVIGDDASTDGTKEIVLDYQRRNPDRIRVLLAEQNLGRVTGNARLNFLRTLRACRGRYVALLDADDYWTSPDKLQTQIDSLERDRTAAMSFHRARWFDQESGTFAPTQYGPPVTKSSYSIDDLLEHHNFLPTSSVVARRELIGSLPEWWLNAAVADFPLHLLLAQRGSIVLESEAMSVYRYHKAGMFSRMSARVKCERALQSLELPARELGLVGRGSYRRGVSALNLDLMRAHAAERHYAAAIEAGVRAVRTAPIRDLGNVARAAMNALPVVRRIATVASRYARVAKVR